MATELFTNYVATTVTSGGTTAPSSGSTESWTVTSSSGFPAAVTGTSQFHVADPALPAETIVMPGHGLDTSIGDELPHLDEWIARGW